MPRSSPGATQGRPTGWTWPMDADWPRARSSRGVRDAAVRTAQAMADARRAGIPVPAPTLVEAGRRDLVRDTMGRRRPGSSLARHAGAGAQALRPRWVRSTARSEPSTRASRHWPSSTATSLRSTSSSLRMGRSPPCSTSNTPTSAIRWPTSRGGAGWSVTTTLTRGMLPGRRSAWQPARIRDMTASILRALMLDELSRRVGGRGPIERPVGVGSERLAVASKW